MLGRVRNHRVGIARWLVLSLGVLWLATAVEPCLMAAPLHQPPVDRHDHAGTNGFDHCGPVAHLACNQPDAGQTQADTAFGKSPPPMPMLALVPTAPPLVLPRSASRAAAHASLLHAGAPPLNIRYCVFRI